MVGMQYFNYISYNLSTVTYIQLRNGIY